jgi:hypothetical protein
MSAIMHESRLATGPSDLVPIERTIALMTEVRDALLKTATTA